MFKLKRYGLLFGSLIIILLFVSCNASERESETKPDVSASNTSDDSALTDGPLDAGQDEETTLQSSINLEGVLNARDLGGYTTSEGRTVRSNLLLRSGELSSITEADIAILTEEYNLSTIIDLRQPDERESKPTQEIPGITNIHISVLSPPEENKEADPVASQTEDIQEEPEYTNPYINLVLSMGDVREGLIESYVRQVTEEYSLEAYRQFFNIMLQQDDGAVLWHCTSGKDRTGIASALVLSALGVDRETIIGDYMLTNEYLKEKIEKAVLSASEETSDPSILDGVRMLNGIDRTFIEAVFAEIEQNYFSIGEFLETQLDLTPDKIIILKEKYTE